jgi:predicted MPP superfamily phosphohydrolase
MRPHRVPSPLRTPSGLCFNLMLTFIHMSDIHFSSGDDASQFDLNQHIRRALLDDLPTRPADGADYDALLITGDIAYSGKKEEYEAAKRFLEEVYGRTGLSMNETYVVPGNHDVDRAHVQPTFPLWASHAEIRQHANRAHWCATIQTQLQKDPSKLLLAPLHAYNDFAQGCGCPTTADALAWNLEFPRPLEFGFTIRLWGLNSALISDEGDEPAKLLVSGFQTAKLRDTLGEVNVVMSHHPPDWLMDKAELREVLRRFAPVTLFGHEHNVRLQPDEKQVQLFAGALQPDRDAPGWLPTYHILQLAIDSTIDQPELLVRVHTREFHNYKFRAWRNEDDKLVFERRLVVPPQTPPTAQPETSPATTPKTMLISPKTMPATEAPTANMQATDAERQLLVYFFQLRTPQRYEAAFNAGLLRDGDDALDPQVMWAEVFRRAKEENKLDVFWTAVAAHTPEMAKIPNPFTRAASA